MKRLSVLSLLFVLAAPAVARVGVINLGLAYYDVTSEVATPRDAGAEHGCLCDGNDPGVVASYGSGDVSLGR